MKRILLSLLLAPALVMGQEPDGYYKNCEGAGGKDLLMRLYETVGPHTKVTYDGLWNVYKDSDVRPNGTVWDMYSTKEWRSWTKCGNYKNVGDCLNREHSFPKSWWGGGKANQYSDAFHLYPTDGKVNNQRSNYPFGECAGGDYLPSNGSVRPLGRLGNSTFPGFSGEVFEPDDQYKGDFARSYFYMAAAYNDKISGWTSGNGGQMLAGNNYPVYKSWAIDMLLKWHRQDPVSQKEIDRNNAVYKHQHNRNPFIDHPELAEYIWGSKKDAKWSLGATTEPELMLPADGSVADIGLCAVGLSKSVEIKVKGVGLTEVVKATISGAGFSVSPSQIAVSKVNAADGTSLTVTFKATSAGSFSGVLTLKSGTYSSRVTLTASAFAGLPAGTAINVSDRSFTAVWTNVGDADASGNYTLYVQDKASGAAAPGYPVKVKAAQERATVFNLFSSTEYEYWLTSQTLTSNKVSVTTKAPIPSIQLLYDGDLIMEAAPGEPSEAYEILLDVENVEDDIVISVDEPFELSLDKGTWTRSITASPLDDHFYLRVNSAKEGVFDTTIGIDAGAYSTDDYEVEATVAAIASFVEDFEAESSLEGYSGGEYFGTASKWKVTEAGIYDSDKKDAHGGVQVVRTSKKSNSALEMLQDKPRGIGVVSFFAKKWLASEADATVKLEVSDDHGLTWHEVDQPVNITSADYAEFRFTANVPGAARIRLAQTAGARFFIDDIAISDYNASGIDDIEDTHRTWDAFCRDRMLVVETAAPATVQIYSVDGITNYNGPVGAGQTEFNLPFGLYVVVIDDFGRRVFVR